ncbi:hypothetical protein [Bradyrhizobium jicamae]|uniref:hypothetical protein n=1 Tax=Bradyrhizobium jicamae TaxID=280332 RepID=UPI001BAAE1AF|nr:hypothetical protein [Bradyrhizobium jicamae]MBR0937298.1 hypothetical protein [Bradyrhizobium jicamae]
MLLIIAWVVAIAIAVGLWLVGRPLARDSDGIPRLVMMCLFGIVIGWLIWTFFTGPAGHRLFGY